MKLLALLTALAIISGCGSSSENPDPNPNPNPNPNQNTDEPIAPHTIGLQPNREFEIDGLQRRYKLFLPAQLNTAKTVLLLHGNGGSSDQILGIERTKAPFKVWMDIALRENLILIVPDGEVGSEGRQGWNDCRTDAPTNPTTDDVLFLSTLIDSVTQEFNVEDPKVYVSGVSNGGMMSMRLADEVPEKLHAFASVVASRPLNNECPDATTPLSALIMNGTADPILPYTGGHIKPQRGELFSTNDAVAYWVNRNQTTNFNNGVAVPDTTPGDGSTITLFSYSGGTNGTQVRHYEVIGGGHTEPSIAEQYSRIWKAVVGEQNNDIEMAEEIWGFFSSL